MNELRCERCNAGPFSNRGPLANHRKTCIGNKRSRIESLSRPSERGESSQHGNEPIELEGQNESINPKGPNESHQPSLIFDVNDVLDDEMEEFYEPDNSSRFFYSTFSLVNWIRTIKREEGLSSTTINRLFREVLLHPDFKIDDLAVKSAYDIEKCERSFYSEED